MGDGLPNYSTIDTSGLTNHDNYDNRRISPIGTCIHTTSGVDSLAWLQFGAAEQGSPASCDYLIGRLGERYKICPDGYYPYHAGQSDWQYNGVTYHGVQVSERLLGVELECRDNELVTWQQIDSLAELIVQLSIVYGWRWPYYLIGHYEVARPIGRRSDPQGLDWGALMGRLYYRAKLAGIAGM